MWESIFLFFQILIVNIVLSGDNAVVIAMASKNLPAAQRNQAIWWGAFGAIGLRLILTLIAVFVLSIPYIQAVGSIFLLWISIKLLIEDDGGKNVAEASSLGKAVRTIILADFIMSLDNVLAIAAMAKNDLAIIILGISLSIPLIIWGSSVVMKLLHRFPILVFLGAGILGYTAGEMFVSDIKMQPYIDGYVPHWIIPIAAGLIVIMIGIIKRWIGRNNTPHITAR
jgi:YjbE family integral membrane protein